MTVPAPTGIHVTTTGRSQATTFFASDRARSFIPSKNFTPGYGTVPQGSVCAENASAAGNTGLMYPYVGDDYTDIATNLRLREKKTFLVADLAQADTTCEIKLEDQYKYKVGDDLVVMEKDGTAEYLGAIISIVAGNISAVITFTKAITAATFTTAKYANVYPLGAPIPSLLNATLSADAVTLTVLVASADKFEFGDTLVVCAPGTAIQNLGTILSVAKGATVATITFTTAIVGTDYTTVNNTVVYALHGALCKAKGILADDLETGGSGRVVTSVTSAVCFGGAMLMTAFMWNMDATAKKMLNITDLSMDRVKYP